TEQARTSAVARATSARLQAAKTEAERTAILKESKEARTAAADATVAQLADAYERGAVLSFFFAEQLRGLETSGFDVANFFADMMTSFDAAREKRRPAEAAEARARHGAARERLRAARAAENERAASAAATMSARNAALIKGLRGVEELLRLKDYPAAETRLRALLQEHPGEPRVFFALAQTARFSAENAFDENLQAQRLNAALANYKMAVERASLDTDRALVSRAYAAMGRILAFLDRNEEASQAFDAAIRFSEDGSETRREAVEGKKKLTP
ncbi:MAG: hypothetical protein ACRD68_10175, partial [Pyrinomonadaceae bacterium]